MLYGLVLNHWSLVPVKLQEVDKKRFHTSYSSPYHLRNRPEGSNDPLKRSDQSL